MKLIIQIPCYNEEQTLAATVADLPRQIEGIDQVELLVIDDGSDDRTVEVAREAGVDHIIQNKRNLGLARAFQTGLDACLRLGADIIVNTDGDNQYRGQDIPRLIAPILRGEADMVIGDRQTETIPHFSPLKKRLQKLGSWVVRRLSEIDVPDAVSGFRAFSREAALRTNILSSFSYTIESLIQAGKKKLTVVSVPVGSNAKTRDSRLFKSVPHFLERSVTTMVRIYSMYQPLRFFFYLGALSILLGMIPSVRFLIAYFAGDGGGHIQSLILAAILFVVGFQFLLMGLVADLISFNRRLSEDILLRLRKLELERKDDSGRE